MHIADPALGILGANGIVGAGIPLAVGAGVAASTRGEDRVAVAFFGEGAVHGGAFHEALTLAVAWCVPVLFVCESNGYAEFTASGHWGGPTLVARAESYGMLAATVDGRDPLAVCETVLALAQHARIGDGPAFIEAPTMRFAGHFEGDAQDYRSEEELAQREHHDPLLLAWDAVGAEAADRIRREADEEMEAAVAAALEAPYPEADAVGEYVYA